MPAAQQQYGAEQEAEDSGEEWWFGHANYTEQGVVTGTVTAGYSSWPNCFWMGSGCTQTVEERIIADYVGNPNAWAPSAQEFERADHRKGETRATVARFDLKGHMLWYRHLLPGLAYNVTEDADGNILVVGHSYTNVWPDDLNLSDPDPSQNDNAVIRYNADGVTDMSTLDCSTMSGYFRKQGFLAKLSPTGRILWCTLLTAEPSVLPGWSIGSIMNDVVALSDGGQQNYWVVGRSERFGNDTKPYIAKVSENGALLADLWCDVTAHPELPDNWPDQGFGWLFSLSKDPFSDLLVLSGVTQGTLGTHAVMGLLDPSGPDLAPEWCHTTSDPVDAVVQQGGHNTNFLNFSTGGAFVRNSLNDTWVVWPALANYFIPNIYSEASGAYLKVHAFDLLGGYQWTTDLGQVAAYDLQCDAVATADGAVAVISTKWDADFSYPSDLFGWSDLPASASACVLNDFGYDVDLFTPGVQVFNWQAAAELQYWNTDPFVAKLNTDNGTMLWCVQWDADANADFECWPEDIRNQECMYRITEAPDGGLVVSGNSSHNFDDYYLAKLFPDCQSREDYDPVIAAAVMATPDRSYTVGVNESWTTDKKIHGTIVIPDGHQLTIGSGAVIRFADSRLLAHPTRIIVEAGGKLNITSSAVLTSLPGCNGQNAMWDGIILRGIPGYPQEPLATTDQGFARLRDCTIEHARTAISVAEIMLTNESMAIAEQNASGGIVIADNAIFRNNIRDVFFSPFENHQGDYPNGLYGIEENKSRFRTCTFENTAQLNDPYQRPQAHATLFGVRGVRFQGCTFTGGVYPMLDAFDNTVLTDQYMGQGIKSIMSTFAVEARCQPQQYGDPCTEEELVRNTFNTLWYGVNASTFGDMSRTFIVDRSDFRSCVKGIRMEGIQDAGITLNTFEVGDLPVGDLTVTPYGVYSDQCTGYEIEENRFGIGAHAAPERKVGLVIKDSGKYPNTYYNNRFDGLFSGTIIEGQNSSEDFTSGLAIKCNDYGNEAICEFDVALTGEAPTIAEQQGAIFNEQSPAGNTFSWSCGSSENDIWVEPSTMHYFEYVHHLQGMDPADPHVEPLCYSQPQIDPFQIIEATGWSYDKSIACPSTRSRERERSMSKQSAAQANDELADAKATYEAIKDNGDTEGLQATVESSTSSLAIRNALLAAAPKVGVETFQAAFDRLNAPLSHWHLTQAIVANSPVQAEVLKLAYNSALEGFYLTLIEQAQTGEVNILSILEAEQSAKAHDKGEELGDLGRNSQLDSLDIDGTLDSLKLFHEDLDAPNNALTILGVSAAKGEWTEAQVLAASLEQVSDEPALYGTVKRWAAAQGNGGWYALDMDTRTWLQALAADRDAQGSAQAQAWLIALGDPEQPEIIALPSLTRSASASNRARVRSAGAEPILVLFPNPANDGVRVAYQLPEDLPSARLTLLDVNGREVWHARSSGGIQLVEVPLGTTATGLYLCRLEVDGMALATERLIVAK